MIPVVGAIPVGAGSVVVVFFLGVPTWCSQDNYQTTDPLCGYKNGTVATSLVASVSRDNTYIRSNGM